MSTTLEQPQTLIIEGGSRFPSMELVAHADGTIKFRHVVEGDNYPGFDGEWRVLSQAEQREHLRLGGKIAERLQTLNHLQERQSEARESKELEEQYSPETCAWCHGRGRQNAAERCQVCGGKGKLLVLQPPHRCITCNCTGRSDSEMEPCPHCQGSGWESVLGATGDQ